MTLAALQSPSTQGMLFDQLLWHAVSPNPCDPSGQVNTGKRTMVFADGHAKFLPIRTGPAGPSAGGYAPQDPPLRREHGGEPDQR
jgi:prepilin-type processing-associated H-X9-DG protein